MGKEVAENSDIEVMKQPEQVVEKINVFEEYKHGERSEFKNISMGKEVAENSDIEVMTQPRQEVEKTNVFAAIVNGRIEELKNMIDNLKKQIDEEKITEFKAKVNDRFGDLSNTIEDLKKQPEQKVEKINVFEQAVNARIGELEKTIKDLKKQIDDENINKRFDELRNTIEDLKKEKLETFVSGSITQDEIQSTKELRERRKVVREEERELQKRADAALNNVMNVLALFSVYCAYLIQKAWVNREEFWFAVVLTVLMLLNLASAVTINWFKIDAIDINHQRIKGDYQKIKEDALSLNLIPVATVTPANNSENFTLQVDSGELSSHPIWGSFYDYVMEPMETIQHQWRLYKFSISTLAIFAFCFAISLIVFLGMHAPAASSDQGTNTNNVTKTDSLNPITMLASACENNALGVCSLAGLLAPTSPTTAKFMHVKSSS
ncbi:hypothetical protein BVC80_1609g40 [Macleaya cordata]|uniref:Transmembrane protein n=1 Tax=Macleaya cordata TaxID=56857 RepID=A0A200Q9V4_MACCD|nr:hypothetical protein BVC80_1609g40 [Macleaya cordata]